MSACKCNIHSVQKKHDIIMNSHFIFFSIELYCHHLADFKNTSKGILSRSPSRDGILNQILHKTERK